MFYVIAKGGTPTVAGAKGPNESIALLAVLGTTLPKSVTINELTTVASTFTPQDSSMGKRSPDMRSGCGSPRGTRRTW